MVSASGPGHVRGAGERIPRSLVRPRLVTRLADPGRYRVGMVVAPAGSGKTRLLAHTADAFEGRVAWCSSPGPRTRSEAEVVDWLWAGLASHVDAARPPKGIDDLARIVEAPGPPLLLVADDLHLLEGSDGELAVEELVRRRLPRLRLLFASRVRPSFDLSALRVSGELVELGPDDLRFRTWEVEELFRDVYGDPLLPEEVALLARRTTGWAAYLQMFHLASGRMSRSDRRQLLGAMAGRPRLVQEYLARHVLAGLDPELQDFLVRTSVLRRPSPAMCDQLLGERESGASAERLAELERRNVFTERVDPLGDTYAYHPVLLAYLDARLVETVGQDAAKQLHGRAGVLLESAFFAEDALAAYARAEDWQGVARILGRPESQAGADWAWLEALPPAVIEADPMLLLARARRELASGNLEQSLQTMRRAESVSGSESVAARCRAEAERLAVWARPDRAQGSDWSSVVRAATQRDPQAALDRAAAIPGPAGRFAEGVVALINGDPARASRLLRGVASNPDAGPVMAAGASFGAVAAGAVVGRRLLREDTERLLEDVEATGVPWLERIVQAGVLGTDADADESIDELIESCQREGDRWGEALMALLGGVGQMRLGKRAIRLFERAALLFSVLGAGVLEALSVAHAALDMALHGEQEGALREAARARTLASIVEAPGTVAMAVLAMGLASGDAEDVERARQVLEPMGIWEWHRRIQAAHAIDTPATPTPAGARSDAEYSPIARLRCLGEFCLELGGSVVDEVSVKPMERALLHMLAASAGKRVHRDVIIEALWPDAKPDAGVHRLQVAVSSLRRLLGQQHASVLRREGDSYRLALPPGSEVDLWLLRDCVDEAASARAAGDRRAEVDSLERALALYVSPLLPGDGAATWVVDARADVADMVARAASRLATLKLEEGDLDGATGAARAGLAVDRYRDDLWQVLIEVSERAGRQAEAGKARREYADVLSELGI